MPGLEPAPGEPVEDEQQVFEVARRIEAGRRAVTPGLSHEITVGKANQRDDRQKGRARRELPAPIGLKHRHVPYGHSPLPRC